jgi:hypothetical protein
MAKREKRLAEFDGEGNPPPHQPVEVLCEDKSGTYQLPFACRYIDGAWRNDESGSMVEATVVGWRLLPALYQNATEASVEVKIRNARGTNRARISE